MSEFDEWDSFYLIVGGAAGALIGLQFVVMTLVAVMEIFVDQIFVDVGGDGPRQRAEDGEQQPLHRRNLHRRLSPSPAASPAPRPEALESAGASQHSQCRYTRETLQRLNPIGDGDATVSPLTRDGHEHRALSPGR